MKKTKERNLNRILRIIYRKLHFLIFGCLLFASYKLTDYYV